MVDNEVTMARAAVRVGAAVAVPVVGLSWLLRGPQGGLTALGAVLLVVGTFYVTGRTLHWAGNISPTVLQAVALGGFFVRLVLYAALIVLLRPVEAIDGHVLAISTAVTLVVVLAYEVRLVLRHAEFWWVLPEARRPAGGGRLADRPATVTRKERA